MFMKIYIEFIMQIDLLIKELKFTSPKKESHEWYVINNLERYLKSLEESLNK